MWRIRQPGIVFFQICQFGESVPKRDAHMPNAEARQEKAKDRYMERRIATSNFVGVFWTTSAFPQMWHFLGVNDIASQRMVCKKNLRRAIAAQTSQQSRRDNDGDDD